MMSSPSTLVATVSINYEDFYEGFLTCGTCLCAYDQEEHAPKLLSCSHTICQNCLELIASTPSLSNTAEAGCIKCPICRQNIAIPTGGISALPPSFLVNQLFDLVNKKPREFIPKCSVHIEQELLFCETCDCVFCDTCNSDNESDASSITTSSTGGPNVSLISSQAQQLQQHRQQNKQHISEACTVIPFSTAIKRMSEILNYRSQQCSVKLQEARDNVQREIDKLDSNCNDAIQDIDTAFGKIRKIIDEREQVLFKQIKTMQEYKKVILIRQLDTIENEKATLSTSNSVKINNEVDVKNLSKKISDLSEKNDTALALYTPRENCLICFESESDEAMDNIRESVNCYGKIRTSKTYPPYCTAKLLHHSTHLRSVALVQSIDYEGSHQKVGGDPLQAQLKLVGRNEEIDGDIVITDKRDGSYEVSFIPPVPGKYQLFIYIFNRPIKSCPINFETNSHHNTIAIFGQSSRKGEANQFDQFSQPASLIINKHNGRVYVMDSFNSRIKVLAQLESQECPFSFMQHIQADFLGRSCTGIALLYPEDDDMCDEHAIQTLSLSPSKPPNPNILVTDWRNHAIYELNSEGKLLNQYNHDDLLEPTNIVVDRRGRILAVDREKIFVFNSAGKLLHKLTGYKHSTIKHEASSVLDDSSELVKQNQQSIILSQAAANLVTAVQSNEEQDKENLSKVTPNSGTLNSYLVNSVTNDKLLSAKRNTLSSLISMKRKPKLNPSSSFQKGSKAVISAASRIRSTLTLSHSTSLVSAASFQSMFHNGNKQHMNNSQPQASVDAQPEFDDCLSTYNNVQSGKQQSQKRVPNKPEQQNNAREAQLNQMLPINDQSDSETMLNTGDDDERTISDETIEPFGIIRGIAIGPNDEVIVADETRVRVLQPGDEYTFKRELFVHTRAGNHHNSNSSYNGRLCSMAYDAISNQLLTLHTAATKSSIPYIHIVDYQTGRTKFIIDSHDSRLIRPSCLATYGQHVIVTDLGNDCIKKYRFY